VLSQVEQRAEADLKSRFGTDKQNCRLSGNFLKKLITGGFKNSPTSYHGVQISNAMIDGPVIVEFAEIDHFLLLSHCLFKDPVSFQKSHFKKDLSLSGSHFLSSANFKATKIEGDVSCENTVFERECLWRDAKINEHFHGEGAEFRDKKGPADFYAMSVGANAFFDSAKFHGPVNFGLTQIGREFYANNAQFLHEQEKAYFNSLKVNQNAIFKGARFHGPVNFVVAQIVQRDLKIGNARIDELEASHMDVKGPARFSNVEIKTLANFRDSSFQTIDFESVKWPEIDKQKNFQQVYLGNLTYTGLSIDKPNNIDYQQKDFEAIKSFVEASPFNTQSYIQMETFFKSIGRESWAKEVFIHMHDRELAEKMSWWDPRRWLEWFWGQIAGYGRAPFRVFFVSLALIILGAFTFNPEYLTPNKMPAKGKTLEAMMLRLFISLDRFLPIELGLASHWDSKGRRFIIWFYFYLQQILGWILIPIALASIYSQLK
jgi:hypothetical protein